MKKFLVVFLLAAVTCLSTVQAVPSQVDGQVIVRLDSASRASSLQRSANGTVERWEVLVPALNLYLARLSPGLSVAEGLDRLGSLRGVVYAHADQVVTRRQLPNDTAFDKQWNLHNRTGTADVRADRAWDIGTGGKDARGNDVVVAVVDGGVDVAHPDLKANIWTNSGEIAGNGKDDDANGYIDDVNGWNAYNGTGTIPADRHGTHVAGIIGAAGNNRTHVAGLNWNVKIMAVAGSSGTTSIIAKAYGYVHAQKKLWIDTRGAKGANVVSTNSSFGVDLADCASAQYKAWNDLYELMGSVGILSAAATANLNIDIDVKGDVPTACASDYILSVTNTDSQDKKNSGAAFGLKHVDLGAPGTAVVSTLPGNTVGPLTGTSMATPHVAGAVALLHSVGSLRFSQFVGRDPAKAAIELKRIMLQSVDANADLKGKTVSGGRLNLYEAAKAIAAFTR